MFTNKKHRYLQVFDSVYSRKAACGLTPKSLHRLSTYTRNILISPRPSELTPDLSVVDGHQLPSDLSWFFVSSF